MAVRIIVVRHGERLDEVDRVAWSKLRTPETRHDPPLTASGWKQARRAGDSLRQVLQRWAEEGHGLQAEPLIYSSPTVRTLSTAAGVAESLGVCQVVPVYGLNVCAAAQQYGVASSGFPTSAPEPGTMGNAATLACWPAQGDAQAVDDRFRRRGTRGFVESVVELADRHERGSVVIMVTHREGIWELHKQVGDRMCRAEYCSVSTYTWDKEKQVLAKFEEKSAAQPVQAIATAHLSQKTCEKTAMLETGKGRMRFHRDAPGPDQATMLWQTPGVRGMWVPDVYVRNGVIVELMCAPVTAENNEGAFVLIRLSCGGEGWTKVKNLWCLEGRGAEPAPVQGADLESGIAVH
eukprot:TRINITY_DN7484_c0_g1_i1.p1 TRINITY_DN7484_c0_g1~~TRINITY_DN7484_c0_g1_i1.p1  ORF type:complete len:349 (+),score=44.74 TRINITY_DN7484_c0_g1_i1:169-1215(+)